MKCNVCRKEVKLRNGAFSCKVCNQFFLIYSEDSSQIHPCRTNSYQCYNISISNIHACQFCTFYKCIEVGMSREGVQFDQVKALVMDAKKNIFSVAKNSMDTMIELIQEANLHAFKLTRHKIATVCGWLDTCFQEKSSDFICPLNISPNIIPSYNKEEELKQYDPIYENVAEFVEGIPGFSLLSSDDQRALLAPGYFQLLVVRLVPLFGKFSLRCPNGQIIHRDQLPVGSKGQLMNLLFTAADEIKEHVLSEDEMGIFSSYILMNPDRTGLKDKYTVSFIRNRLKNFLCHDIRKQFDINDLTRISDYLDVAYKTHESCSDFSKRLGVISKPSPQDYSHIPVTSAEETVHSSAKASTSRVQERIFTEERLNSSTEVKNIINPIPRAFVITNEKVENLTEARNYPIEMEVLSTEERVDSSAEDRNDSTPRSFLLTEERVLNLRDARNYPITKWVLTPEEVDSSMAVGNYPIPMEVLNTEERVDTSIKAMNYPIPMGVLNTEELRVGSSIEARNYPIRMGVLKTEERVDSSMDARNYHIPRSFLTTEERVENLREVRNIQGSVLSTEMDENNSTTGPSTSNRNLDPIVMSLLTELISSENYY